MLEECVDFLELATKALNKKIIMLEEEENALLFNNNTDSNSVDANELITGLNIQPAYNQGNAINNNNKYLNFGANHHQFSTHSTTDNRKSTH